MTTSQIEFAEEGKYLREGVLWVALAIALSPVLADLGRHLVASPWARYTLVFPLLTVRALRRCPVRGNVRKDGIGLLLLALGLELLAVGGGIPRAGRLGIPLAGLGLARVRGFPSPRIVALLAWWVPVPHGLVKLGSPQLEAALAGASAALWQHLGVTLHVTGAGVTGAHGALPLDAADGGVPLLGLLSGMGWYAATLRGGNLQRLVGTAAEWALVAIPIQAAAVFLAVGWRERGLPTVRASA